MTLQTHKKYARTRKSLEESKILAVRVDKELANLIDQVAERTNSSQSSVIQALIRRQVKSLKSMLTERQEAR